MEMYLSIIVFYLEMYLFDDLFLPDEISFCSCYNCLLLLLVFFYLKICLSVGYPSHRNICWKHSSTAGKTQPYVPMGLHMGLKSHMSRIKFPEQMKPPVRIQTGMVGERFAGGGRLRKESIGGIRL